MDRTLRARPPRPAPTSERRWRPTCPSLAGTFEVVTTPALIGEDGASASPTACPRARACLKLHGKMADLGEWRSGGLVTESEGTAWRMAAEFVLMPGGGHEIQTGGGYGTRYVRPLAGEGSGRHPRRPQRRARCSPATPGGSSEDWTASFGRPLLLRGLPAGREPPRRLRERSSARWGRPAASAARSRSRPWLPAATC